MGGQGFQFTLGGFVPLKEGGAGTVPGSEIVPLSGPIAEPATPIPNPSNVIASQPPSLFKPQALQKQVIQVQQVKGPGDVIRMAKERLKAIKAELKNHRKLLKEKAELERLLNAAKQKPSPKVRALTRAG